MDKPAVLNPHEALRRVLSEILERTRRGEEVSRELLEDLRRQVRELQELNRKAQEAYPELKRRQQQIEADAEAWLNRLNRPGRRNPDRSTARVRPAWAPREAPVDVAASEAAKNPAHDPFIEKSDREAAIKAASSGGTVADLSRRIGVDYRDLRAWVRDRGLRLAKGKSDKVRRIEDHLLTHTQL